MATYFVADQHYFHEGIIRLCARPFDNARQMNDALRTAHNAVVKNDDDVIFLGDFAHRAGDPNELRKLFDSLNGRKILVPGNHDGPATLGLPWAQPAKDILLCSAESTRLVLCHFALRVWPSMHKGSTLHLFGHSHGRLPGNDKSMDIGVDVMGWAPVTLKQIKQRLATLPPLVDPEGGDDLENIDGVKP
jgi:calcineurin-like phosphoesterase family protein